ncbi:MAG: hypothetical protein QXG00_07930 [Candidatus Woesearchaeota archaeon]
MDVTKLCHTATVFIDVSNFSCRAFVKTENKNIVNVWDAIPKKVQEIIESCIAINISGQRGFITIPVYWTKYNELLGFNESLTKLAKLPKKIEMCLCELSESQLKQLKEYIPIAFKSNEINAVIMGGYTFF